MYAQAYRYSCSAGTENGLPSKSALERLRNELVSNYVQQRDKLLNVSLPEVRSAYSMLTEPQAAHTLSLALTFCRDVSDRL